MSPMLDDDLLFWLRRRRIYNSNISIIIYVEMLRVKGNQLESITYSSFQQDFCTYGKRLPRSGPVGRVRDLR